MSAVLVGPSTTVTHTSDKEDEEEEKELSSEEDITVDDLQRLNHATLNQSSASKNRFDVMEPSSDVNTFQMMGNLMRGNKAEMRKEPDCLPAFLQPDCEVPSHLSELRGEWITLPWFKPDSYCCFIRNVFTREECAEMVRMTERMRYPSELPQRDFMRHNHRIMVDSPAISHSVFRRIQEFVPPVWECRHSETVNERLRFLRYHPGMYFAPHFDGQYRRRTGERSFWTLLLYLNDDFRGGLTAFVHPREGSSQIHTISAESGLGRGHSSMRRDRGSEGMLRYEVPIETGSVLLFDHYLFHEGLTLEGGIKYCMRSDVMYSRRRVGRAEQREAQAKFHAFCSKYCHRKVVEFDLDLGVPSGHRIMPVHKGED